MNKSTTKINYEPEADVLSVESSPAPIDYAKEVGNVVVHFTRDNQPVLLEILEASKFLDKSKNLVQAAAKNLSTARV